jgi:hypothetical protein
MVPLLAIGAVLNASFLSRGSTNIRIADVGVPAAVILAWVVSALIGRDGRRLVPNGAVRILARAAAVVVLGGVLLAANGLNEAWRHLREAYYATGPLHVANRASEVWDALGVSPPAFSDDDEQPRLLQLASYLNACTNPTDRLFVLGVYPELYYFSDRPFAGGHAWLLPFYYSNEGDEARIVARLRSAPVPIVITEGGSEYEEEYRPVFEQVDAYLRDEYVHAGDVDVSGDRPLRVLVRSGLEPMGQYDRLSLPCFRP